jgi:hypothetical protein
MALLARRLYFLWYPEDTREVLGGVTYLEPSVGPWKVSTILAVDDGITSIIPCRNGEVIYMVGSEQLKLFRGAVGMRAAASDQAMFEPRPALDVKSCRLIAAWGGQSEILLQPREGTSEAFVPSLYCLVNLADLNVQPYAAQPLPGVQCMDPIAMEQDGQLVGFCTELSKFVRLRRAAGGELPSQLHARCLSLKTVEQP